LFGSQPARAPRYFQIIFLAFAKLVLTQNQEIADVNSLIGILNGAGGGLNVPEGGRWGATDRQNAVNAAAGMIAGAFRTAETYDPSRVRWITQMENILTQSYTEQAAYDFKQGLLRLDGNNTFDEESFEKVLKTLVGVANIRRGTTGYVLVGISDRQRDALRVEELFGVTARVFERFFVTGIEHEIQAMGSNIDQLFRHITERVRNSKVSEPLRDYIARHVKLVRYYDKSVLIFEAKAQDDPSNYDGRYFKRHGSELIEVPPTEFPELFRRFQRGF